MVGTGEIVSVGDLCRVSVAPIAWLYCSLFGTASNQLMVGVLPHVQFVIAFHFDLSIV